MQIPANGDILQLLTPSFAQCTKLFFLLNTAISSATQISRNSRSTTTGKRVKYPRKIYRICKLPILGYPLLDGRQSAPV